jgi:excisionase family DNA binding protein
MTTKTKKAIMAGAPTESPLLTVPETAKFLRVSESLVNHMLRRGEITPRRLGDRVFFSRSYLERFCDEGR